MIFDHLRFVICVICSNEAIKHSMTCYTVSIYKLRSLYIGVQLMKILITQISNKALFYDVKLFNVRFPET